MLGFGEALGPIVPVESPDCLFGLRPRFLVSRDCAEVSGDGDREDLVLLDSFMASVLGRFSPFWSICDVCARECPR